MTHTQSLRADWIAIAAGAGALALLMGALGFQYLLGLAPCHMCHWQRWPYIAAALLGILGGGFAPRHLAWPIAWATLALIAVSALIGLYQTGMQYHILPGPTSCTVDHPYILGSNAPPEVRCDIPTWFFLGLALPAWNAILGFAIAGLGAFGLSRIRHGA